MKAMKCSVCGGTGRVHYRICGVEVSDSCPVCAGLGIIAPELHDLVEVRLMEEVRHDRV